MKKILNEDIQCSDKNMARIASFMLNENARKWWMYERTRRCHTWTMFKTVFHNGFCPPGFVETKWLEFDMLTKVA